MEDFHNQLNSYMLLERHLDIISMKQVKLFIRYKPLDLQLNDLTNAEHVIAVAGGASKAKAIRAYMKQAPSATILITDEGAANEILHG